MIDVFVCEALKLFQIRDSLEEDTHDAFINRLADLLDVIDGAIESSDYVVAEIEMERMDQSLVDLIEYLKLMYSSFNDKSHFFH